MSNKGTIEMVVTPQGKATYTLTLELRDDVGEVIPMVGTSLSSEQKRQLALKTLQNALQRQIVRYETYERLTKAGLKKTLLYKTGSARLNTIRTLDLKYKIGQTEIKSHFHY